MTNDFHPAYFETHFRGDDIDSSVVEFAIITAYATTGEQWSDERNKEANECLRTELEERRARILGPLTGYSPSTDHAEPGWAVEMGLYEACDLGLRHKQDAIYYVRGGVLHVSYCDERRGLVEVGPFLPRFAVDS